MARIAPGSGELRPALAHLVQVERLLAFLTFAVDVVPAAPSPVDCWRGVARPCSTLARRRNSRMLTALAAAVSK